ncbi:hypothetical protein ACI798_06730 [Geodermatophilus sp. SYSU D01045]
MPGLVWAAVVLFGVVGLFTFWVGLLDVLSAADLQYKLIGLAFAVAGLALFAGSAVLLRESWRYTHGRIAAVAAGVAGALAGIYLLLMQYRAPGLSPSRLPPFPAWVPWAGITVASVAGAVLGWTSTKDHAATQVKWTALGGRLVAGGLSVTVLFGGVQWWYTQQYQPGTIAAALTVTTELKPAASEADTADPHLFEGSIKIENVSDTKVQIVSSLYQVTEVTYTPRTEITGVNPLDEERQALACFVEELAPVTDPECDQPTVFEYGDFSAGDPRAQDDAAISRTGQPDAFQVLQLGQVLGDGSWLEAREEYQHNILVNVPEQLTDPNQPTALRTLELSASLAVAQGSRLVLEKVPGHGPEMVPQALLSNEEYRDYKEAEESVRSEGLPTPVSATSTADEPDTTVEVDRAEREAYYQELTMPPAEDSAAIAGTPATLPRPYPHRYTVVEWPVEDLSTLHRLAAGSQVVTTVQVLSMRLYDPVQRSLTEIETAEMVSCINPAGTLEGRDDGEDIRRDPTAVCPGMWYSLDEDDGTVQNDYERRYHEMIDYREDMADFYGLVQTGAADVVSLTTEAEAAATTRQSSLPFHDLPSTAFEVCEPEMEWAGLVTDVYGVTAQRAFDHHAAEMTGTSDEEGTEATAAPTLEQGVEAADSFDVLFEVTHDGLTDCAGVEAPAETPAAACTAAADEEIGALGHLRDLGEALREHHAVMQQLADGSISAREAAAMGEPSLDRGIAASTAYDQTQAEVAGLLADCR